MRGRSRNFHLQRRCVFTDLYFHINHKFHNCILKVYKIKIFLQRPSQKYLIKTGGGREREKIPFVEIRKKLPI